MSVYGDFYRFDRSPIWDIHNKYFIENGLKPWQKSHVPHSGVTNYTEAFKKAQLFIENLEILYPEQAAPEINILEIGSGNGEFAKNFLTAFTELAKAKKREDFLKNLNYSVSDFSETVLSELKASGKLDEFSGLNYLHFDIMQETEHGSYDLILGTYILDQLPARIFAKDKNDFYEKYLAIADQKLEPDYFSKQLKAVKKLKKKHEFRQIDLQDEIAEDEFQALLPCFRKEQKSSTVVYSYSALHALKNLLKLLKFTGIIMISDFHGSSKGGFDKYEPCYYGNSIAQAVNFEFICNYLENSLAGAQKTLLYEDPIKPLHTLILTSASYPMHFELSKRYKKVYIQNWLLRAIFKFLVDLKLAFVVFLLILVLTLLLNNPIANL